MAQKGLLISLEGIDGSGKSTLAQHLKTFFVQRGRSVVLTKEPGSTPVGMKLRALLQESPEPLCPQAEFLLFAADRAEHMHTIIMPALQRGQIIISDRMADSSLAYQGYGKGLDVPMLTAINAWAMNSIQPHITLYLRLDYETAHQRCIARNERATAFEKRGREYMLKVIQCYDDLAQAFPARIHTIDATASHQEVLQQALAIVQHHI